MITITDKHLCCGCSACAQSCPKHCIAMQEDEEGFLYPLIHTESCVECGICEKVCPVINQSASTNPLEVYAAQNKNQHELLQSSSGGIFILLAKHVLKEGGVIFGAKFDKNWDVVHAYADTEEDVGKFMGSKYVQSCIGNTYHEAKMFLAEGRKVLFSGTPCQIAGLKRYLKTDYDNLLTVDIICHGVPSPKVWRRYLEEIRQNPSHTLNVSDEDVNSDRVEITDISFRDKRLGWKKYSFFLSLDKIMTDGNRESVSLSHVHRDDSYMKLFLKNFILRPSCYKCPSKGGKSHSDITLADFWGIEKVLPEFYDTNGVGLLMLNSDKGKEIVKYVDMSLHRVSIIDGVADNPSYYSSVQEPVNRNKCFDLLKNSKSSLTEIIQILNYTPLHIRVGRKLKLMLLKLLGK